MWMGYTPPPPRSQSQEYLSLKSQVAEFTRLHPKIHIQLEYVNNDYALQKVTVALQGGQPPDISYQYGTNMPQVSQAPAVVNLTKIVQQPGFGWSDFVPGERAVATVGGAGSHSTGSRTHTAAAAAAPPVVQLSRDHAGIRDPRFLAADGAALRP